MTSTLVPLLLKLPYLKRDLWASCTPPVTAAGVMWMGDCSCPPQLHLPLLGSLPSTQSSPAKL
jgi:hypothetical protein